MPENYVLQKKLSSYFGMILNNHYFGSYLNYNMFCKIANNTLIGYAC
jgi:hypothetical protein